MSMLDPITDMDFPRDWKRENRGIRPHFFVQRLETKNEDGTTGMLDLECCRLTIAGDELSAPVLPVDDGIRERFAAEYEAFCEEREARVLPGRRLATGRASQTN